MRRPDPTRRCSTAELAARGCRTPERPWQRTCYLLTSGTHEVFMVAKNNHSEPAPHRATAQMLARPGQYLVPTSDTPHMY
ncbi:hypothetical protein WMF26_33670 [Sorangium sp. So ce185]|uniref:hypothetical protein n=1 Tax=Sorangium sp. So ce185 TaxID=3133287 RepID=UPI003F63FAFC